MWLPTRADYTEQAMKFADENVQKHYDRMGYGYSPQAVRERRSHIYIGKIAEYTICQYLEDELGLEIARDASENGPDLFDFKINLQNKQPTTGDVKSFHIYKVYSGHTRSKKQVETDSWALVPTDQYKQRPKDLYIFVMVLGDFDLPQSPNKTGDCFVKWSTQEDIQGWDFIPKGFSVFPYYGTRTDNYGQKMSECNPMEDFLNKLLYEI